MSDQPLAPAARGDLVETLSYALRFSREGRRMHERDLLAANAAAEHLLEALERSGFVVMRAPPAPDHAVAPRNGGPATVA
jgi:hypothetical protein